jgi:hypothetical protein
MLGLEERPAPSQLIRAFDLARDPGAVVGAINEQIPDSCSIASGFPIALLVLESNTM